MTAPVPPDANGLREAAWSARAAQDGWLETSGQRLVEAAVNAISWHLLDGSMDTADREPSAEMWADAQETARALLAASEAAPTAGERCTCVGRDPRQTHGVGCPLGPATVEEFLRPATPFAASEAAPTAGEEEQVAPDCTCPPDDPNAHYSTCPLWVWTVMRGTRRPATPPADDASPSWMRDVPEEMLNEERLNVLLSEFYHSDDADYVSALGDIRKHVAARESDAATRARAERAAEALREAADVIAETRRRGGYVDHQTAARIERWLRDRAASIARSDAAPRTGGES